MRTKKEEVPELEQAAEQIMSDADREELEQLRAERDARIAADKAAEEAQKKIAESITINLPPAAGKGIHLNGKMYYHGFTYNVSNDVKWTLLEIMNRCLAHEASLHESENKGRKQRRAFVATGE